MDLASLLMPMLTGQMGAGGQQPPQMGQMTAAQQGGLSPFYDPTQLAQLQTDTLNYQRRNQLAQSLMQNGSNYIPNSGKFGVISGLAQMLGGTLAQRSNDTKLSDIVRRQIEAQSQAAQAQHMQERQDQTFKTDEEIRKDEAGNKSKLANAGMSYAAGLGGFDPRTGQVAIDPNIQKTILAQKQAEANIAAAGREAPGAAGQAKMQQIAALMKQPDSPTKTAQLSALLGEGGMQALAFGSMGAGGGSPGATQGPTGDDFLKTLSPGIAGQVKAISEGRQAPPSSMAMRSPMGQALMQAVAQYDPTFDATNYAARSKTRNAFTAGKEGQTVNAMNTAIGHAGTALEAANALNNTSFPLVNQGLNALAVARGDPRINNFNVAADALAGELTKAFRGSSGSEKDIESAKANLNAAGSPEQMKAAVQQAIHLLASKNSSLQNQYQAAFGSNSQPNFLDPKAQAVLKKLSSNGVDLGEFGGTLDSPADSASTATGGGLSDADLLRKYGGG